MADEVSLLYYLTPIFYRTVHTVHTQTNLLSEGNCPKERSDKKSAHTNQFLVQFFVYSKKSLGIRYSLNLNKPMNALRTDLGFVGVLEDDGHLVVDKLHVDGHHLLFLLQLVHTVTDVVHQVHCLSDQSNNENVMCEKNLI